MFILSNIQVIDNFCQLIYYRDYKKAENSDTKTEMKETRKLETYFTNMNMMQNSKMQIAIEDYIRKYTSQTDLLPGM